MCSIILPKSLVGHLTLVDEDNNHIHARLITHLADEHFLCEYASTKSCIFYILTMVDEIKLIVLAIAFFRELLVCYVALFCDVDVITIHTSI